MLDSLQKHGVKRSSNSRVTLCKEIKQSDWQLAERIFGPKIKNQNDCSFYRCLPRCKKVCIIAHVSHDILKFNIGNYF